MKRTLKSTGNMSCNGRGVFSSGKKGVSGAENSFRTVRRLRKTGVVNRNWLALPMAGKKIAENHPTHHEHEPKWEIPV